MVRQLAEHLARHGHEVTVATTAIPERKGEVHNGVHITGFKVSGNQVHGLVGEVGRYCEFLAQTDADIVFFYAAQQWTFDAAWEVLSLIKARKVLVPCGYSGFYLNAYTDYFKALPQVLAKMDAVVYHAQSYRDIDFARKGITTCRCRPLRDLIQHEQNVQRAVEQGTGKPGLVGAGGLCVIDGHHHIAMGGEELGQVTHLQA